MPVPNDPKVRTLRARIAGATRQGNAVLAENARHELDVLLAEQALRQSLPLLTCDERAALALVAMGAKP